MGSITARIGVTGIAINALVAATLCSASTAGAVHRAGAPKLGHWTTLSGAKTTVESGTPAIWQDSKHRASVLWLREISSNEFTYEVEPVAANGKPGTAVDAFAGGHWGSLSNEPTLVGSGGKPLVVFTGLKGTSGDYATGCIFGADGSSQPWTLESWSLSNKCINPVGAAGEDKSGTVAAAWGSGNSVKYRIGTSPTIPATGPDRVIPLADGGVPYKTGVVADTGGNDDFYIAWAQEFSSPASHDGIYVKDVTAAAPTLKAPGSDTNTINRIGVFTNLAVTARSGHPGVYLAYCTSSAKCQPKLWHVGAAKALSLPGSPSPGSLALASGPGGRLWVAWFDESTTKLYVTRTNQKVSKVGPVRSYKTPCFEHGIPGLSSGSSGRLDVALQCVSNGTAKAVELFTQVEVGLHVSASTTKVRNTSKHSITMSVTDAGDAVSGAKVKFDGQTRSTNGKGNASFTVAKHTKPGSYQAVATKSQYLRATTHVTVTS
jgi:hypothetical protein